MKPVNRNNSFWCNSSWLSSNSNNNSEPDQEWLAVFLEFKEFHNQWAALKTNLLEDNKHNSFKA